MRGVKVVRGRKAWGAEGMRRHSASDLLSGGPTHSRLVGKGRGHEAHIEDAAHVCDAGDVKIQGLVEGRRLLPS